MPDRTINTRENAGGLKVYTAGKGYSDVLIECSGAAPALTGGIATLRSRGRIVQLGPAAMPQAGSGWSRSSPPSAPNTRARPAPP